MNTVNVQTKEADVSGSGDPANRAETSHRQPTIKDVALAAGVSRATVTRSLNEVDAVSPMTRARVLEAIALTGWTRNEAAAALGARKSNPATT